MKKIAPVLALAFAAVLVYAHRSERPPGAERYDRIVSIVPSVTELLFEVGAGDQVAGVTTYCAWPPEAERKEKIGDIVVNYEKVLALEPDAVFSSRLAHPSNLALERMGVRVVRVDAESFEEIADQLRRLGRLTGHAERGEEAARRLRERVRAVEGRVQGKPRPSVFFESSFDPLWTAGPASYAGDAIRRAGGRNVMDDLPRPWAPVSWEVVLARDPDVILIAHGQTADLESRAGWSKLKAVKTGRVHRVPKESFIYPTPRLADGLELCARLFHEKD